MALTATLTAKTSSRGGARFVVSIAGTSVAAATEGEITGLPVYGRTMLLRESLGAGTATPRPPGLGTATNPAPAESPGGKTAAAIPRASIRPSP